MIKATTNAPNNAVVTNGVSMYKSETGCCPTGLTQCRYSLSNAAIVANVRTITVTLPDGTDVAWTLAAADYASAAALRAFIKTKANAIGYQFSEMHGLESTAPSVVIDDTANTIEIISELVFKNIITAAAATVAFTAECTRVSSCEYEVVFDGATNPVLTIGDTDYEITGVFAYPPVGTELADMVTAIDTALAAVTDYYGSAVVDDATVNDGEGGYVVTINLGYGQSVILNDVAAVNNGCTPDWTT